MTNEWLESVRAESVAPGEIGMWYTGGAGYVLKTSGATLLLDPFTGPSNPPDWIRAIPPAYEPDDVGSLGPIDAVLLTHEHGDHADPVSLEAIAKLDRTTVFGPKACVDVALQAGVPVGRTRVLKHGETVEFGDLSVTAVAMHDPGAPGCNGYLLSTGYVTVLQCGDSLTFSGFAELGDAHAIDAICLSVGTNPPGKNFYLDEAGAARAARDARARILIAQHHDLWQGITLDPARVATVAGWYSPGIEVIPASFQKRITIAPLGQ